MINRVGLIGLFVLLCTNVAGCSDEGGECDAGALNRALADAEPGETVNLGACEVAGYVTVPAGVTLSGEGEGASIIMAPAGAAAVTLTPGSTPAVLSNLTVQSDGPVGIIMRGTGQATVTNVTVNATRGVALGAEELSLVTLSDVTLVGPVTADTASTVPPNVTPENTATHGLVLVNVVDADLSNVTASGFARFGALLIQSATTWRGGGATANLATGLMVDGGSVTLEQVDLSGTLQGNSLIPAYGGVFASGADAVSSGLEVSDSGGYGLLHSSATAQHVDLVARNNNDAAVWVQRSDSFELSGSGSELIGNRFAGVVAVDSSNVVVCDATIDETRSATRVVGAGAVEVGDGIQLVRSTESVLLENLSLTENERVGILIELGGDALDDATLRDISVDGSGQQLGVVVQGGTVPDGWDTGVSRGATLQANDAAFSGSLGIVDLVGPNDVPIPGDVSEQGLDALVGPND